MNPDFFTEWERGFQIWKLINKNAIAHKTQLQMHSLEQQLLFTNISDEFSNFLCTLQLSQDKHTDLRLQVNTHEQPQQHN